MNEIQTTKVLIGEVRLSYVHVFRPEAISEGSEPKYSVCLLIPKDNEELLNKIKAGITVAYNAGIGRFGGKLPAKGQWKSPIRDGEERIERNERTGEIEKGHEFEGCYFINATSKTKPGVVKPGTETKITPILDEEELKSGDYGYVSVNFFAYNNAGNKGIAAGLNNVLKTRSGDPLGGRVSAETDFSGLDVAAITGDIPDDIF